MDVVKRAKAYIKCMKATDSTSEHHKLIVGLLLEVKCLKVQVRDRGNSYQKVVAEVERLHELDMKRIDDFEELRQAKNREIERLKVERELPLAAEAVQG